MNPWQSCTHCRSLFSYGGKGRIYSSPFPASWIKQHVRICRSPCIPLFPCERCTTGTLCFCRGNRIRSHFVGSRFPLELTITTPCNSLVEEANQTFFGRSVPDTKKHISEDSIQSTVIHLSVLCMATKCATFDIQGVVWAGPYITDNVGTVSSFIQR